MWDDSSGTAVESRSLLVLRPLILIVSAGDQPPEMDLESDAPELSHVPDRTKLYIPVTVRHTNKAECGESLMLMVELNDSSEIV